MKPNDFQRQLLADEIDATERSIASYREAVAKLERQLEVKKSNLQKLIEKSAKLQEGVDW